jgi:hypothetical protein
LQAEFFSAAVPNDLAADAARMFAVRQVSQFWRPRYQAVKHNASSWRWSLSKRDTVGPMPYILDESPPPAPAAFADIALLLICGSKQSARRRQHPLWW